MSEKCKCSEKDCGNCDSKKEDVTLKKAKGDKPLVNGYRDEKVIMPLAMLQNRIEQMEEAVNKNFEMVNQNRYSDFQYMYGNNMKVNKDIEELRMTLDVVISLLGVDTAVLAESLNNKKAEVAALKELEEDKKSNRTKVDRESTAVDIVQFDFVGKVDGVAFEGGSAKGYHLDLEHSNFIPGFAEQLIGVKAGQIVDVKTTFPTEYHNEKLAGKEAVFTCTVLAVKEKVVQA